MDPSVIANSEFPPTDLAAWRKLAEKTLKGVDFEEAMVGKTGDGIRIDPLHGRAQDTQAMGRAGLKPWRIVQRIDDPDPKRANEQALRDINGGATGLSLVFAGAPNAFGYGLQPNAETLSAVLDGVPLDKVYLRSDAHPNSQNAANWLLEYLTKRRVNPEKLRVSFGIDPAARFAGTGKLRVSIEALQASMPQSLAGFFAIGVPGVLIEADGRVYHNAGATEAQELGAIIATAISHLRMFEQARQPLVYSAPFVGFAISADQNQFLTLAKMRALRLLWQKVQEDCGIEPSPARIHAETSYSMLTHKDPETNILRNTIAAFAAASGGADSVSVLPHTVAHGLSDSFARRIARNTQLVLASEAGVGNVADPAAGSGSIETLTEALCGKAWERFKEIEAEGGILSSLRDGKLQQRVKAMLEDRRTAMNDGSRKIVGTTLYPADKERKVTTIDVAPIDFNEEGQAECERLDPVRNDELVTA